MTTFKYVLFEEVVYRVYDSINYIAVDNDGEINGYENEPEYMSDSELGQYYIQENGCEQFIGFSKALVARCLAV